jgi:MFS family permease
MSPSRSETILTEPIIVAVPRGHRLAERSEVELRELADEEWVAARWRIGSGCGAPSPSGVSTFAAASAVCGAAPTTAVLIAARLVQGLGAALMVPCSLSLVQVAFDEAPARSRAISVWSATGALGVAGGPLGGGALIAAVGWRAIFEVNVVVGVPLLALTRIAARGAPAGPRRADLPGQLAALAAAGGLTFALIEAPSRGWTDPLVLAALGALAAGVSPWPPATDASPRRCWIPRSCDAPALSSSPSPPVC